MATIPSQSPENKPMLSNTKAFGTLRIVVVRTLKISFAVMVTLVSALVVNTSLSYTLPRIFPEAPREDVYEMPSLATWVIVIKHSVTLVLSVWGGVSTGQYLTEPHLREGYQVDQIERTMAAHRDGLPYPMCQRDLPSQRRQEQVVESANRGVGAKSHRTRSSTTPMPSTLQDWTLYEAHVVRASVSNSNTISGEDDALSIALADDVSERDPELRHWYAPPKPSPLLVSCLPLMCLEKAQEPAAARSSEMIKAFMKTIKSQAPTKTGRAEALHVP